MDHAMIANLQRVVMSNPKRNTENIRKWTLWLRLLTQYLEEEESNKETVSMEPNIFECDCNHVFRIPSWDTSSNLGSLVHCLFRCTLAGHHHLANFYILFTKFFVLHENAILGFHLFIVMFSLVSIVFRTFSKPRY